MTNLSERGLGLLAHEAHRPGERIAVTFTLPGEEDALTTTGIVRWCGATPIHRRWYPLGLEWLPLEQTTRYQIETFIKSRRDEEAKRPAFSQAERSTQAAPVRFWSWMAIAFSGLAVAGLTWYVLWLQAENTRLSEGLQQRVQVVGQRLSREQHLVAALQAASMQLTATRHEVDRLDAQTKQFEVHMEALSQDVGQFQVAYTTVRDEREQLMQRVAALEQERGALEYRLTSLPELQRAIREAVAARKQRAGLERANRRAASRRRLAREITAGNQGYLVRDGEPTASGTVVEVVIHEPAAVAASGDTAFTIPSAVP